MRWRRVFGEEEEEETLEMKMREFEVMEYNYIRKAKERREEKILG